MTKSINQRIGALEAELGELLKEASTLKHRYVPEMGEGYFAINLRGTSVSDVWEGAKADYYRLSEGGVFRTVLEAKTYSKIQSRYAELTKDYAPDWNDMGQDKYYLFFKHSEDVFMSSYTWNNQNIGTKYMSRTAAETIREEFTTEELKIWGRM